MSPWMMSKRFGVIANVEGVFADEHVSLNVGRYRADPVEQGDDPSGSLSSVRYALFHDEKPAGELSAEALDELRRQGLVVME